jgi:hypothetical protein
VGAVDRGLRQLPLFLRERARRGYAYRRLFAAQGSNVLYGAIGFDGAEGLLAKLGKHTTGKGCLYIRKLADVDVKVLETLIQEAVAATKSGRRK